MPTLTPDPLVPLCRHCGARIGDLADSGCVQCNPAKWLTPSGDGHEHAATLVEARLENAKDRLAHEHKP